MDLQIFADISKVDEEKRMVYGYASTTALDNQGEMIKREALAEALPDYLKFSNIREMHQPSAVGVAQSVDIDEKGIYLAAKIEDEIAWNKVKTKVYKGFSIGGKSLSKVDNIIEKLRISEISLVDRPANPECVIELYKADGIEIEKVAEREDVNPKEGKEKYGNVEFADAKNKKYPIDNEEHIRAAWNYINKEKNAGKYASKDLSTIKNKILKAWKDKIGGQPPSAQKSDGATNMKKGMWDVSCLASLVDQLNSIRERAATEASIEGDDSQMPDKLKDAVNNLAECLKDMVAEETQELTEDDDDATPTPEVINYAEKTQDIEKAGARNSKSDKESIQKMHDLSMELGADCGGADSVKSAISANDDIKKIEDLQGDIAKLSQEKDELQKRVEELENLPEPIKGKLKAVEKADDYKDKEDDEIKKTDDPIEMIKMVHRKPMQYTHFIRK